MAVFLLFILSCMDKSSIFDLVSVGGGVAIFRSLLFVFRLMFGWDPLSLFLGL